MTSSADSLRWSAQYHLAWSGQPTRLQGDKITLPQSALESLLAAAPIVPVDGQLSTFNTSSFDPFTFTTFAERRQERPAHSDRQQQLPHPLTFRLVNPQNGRVVYAGIREFSAEEGEIGLSRVLLEALGLSHSDETSTRHQEQLSTGQAESDGLGSTTSELITVHAHHLPKGTCVRLRPLEAGYDSGDWKSLLERHLRDSFTTLTNGEILSITAGRHEKFDFLIDRLEPSGEGICIIDTDLEVIIEALNEEQARETLSRKLAKAQRAPDAKERSSAGGILAIGEDRAGQVVIGGYVDYEVTSWPTEGQGIRFQLDSGLDDAELDLFFSPLSSRQRAKPRNDEHVLGDFSSRPSKRIRLSSTNEGLTDAEALYISVHAYRTSPEVKAPSTSIPFILRAGVATSEESHGQPEPTPHSGAEEGACKNCRQSVPARTLPLHEAFCYRNNVSCRACNQVFLKASGAWSAHWHCPLDSSYGNTVISRRKHDAIYHRPDPYVCPNCDLQASSLAVLATHRTSTCPGKEILCQFCHLVAPQQGPEDPPFTEPAVIISGLTPHEFTDGARTTDCHLCGKAVRLRDMKTHLGIHDRDRLLRPPPRICRNALCGNILTDGTENTNTNSSSSSQHPLGLCTTCFTPLYASVHDDSTGKLLRRRVERRLLHQLMAGCGRRWCRNVEFCRTAAETSTAAAAKGDAGSGSGSGSGNSRSIKQLLPLITPILDTLQINTNTNTNINVGVQPLHFCVDDEVGQRRRVIARVMRDREAEYLVEWWVYGLWETRASSAVVAVVDVAGGGDADADVDERRIDRARDWLRDRAPRIGEVVGMARPA